ncbi:MAG: hypothetical protein IPJ65_39350 [Archangiaceae bacterium]|nr:hypothetical protein [Archangiaceae bacterium]
MRIKALEHQHPLKVKLKFALMRLMNGRPVPDVMRALHYRQKRFGEPFSAWLQAVLRGPSDWSVGERELFASFVSNLNRCRF